MPGTGIFITGMLLGAIGLVLNITEVTLLARQKTGRTKYQNLILSLSSADICTSLFFLSSFVYQHEFAEEKEKSDNIFVIAQELLWFSVSSSLLHVLAISFDRLLAIRFPVKHRLWFTHGKNTKLIILIWVLSFLLILPPIVIHFLTESNYKVKMVIIILVLIAAPLIVILYAYIVRKTVSKECIFEIITLHSGKREIVSACSPREKRILMTSILIVISFFICNVPFAIKYIITKVTNYTILLLLSNSILNPLIYFFQRYFQDKKDETTRRKTQEEDQKGITTIMIPTSQNADVEKEMPSCKEELIE